MGILQSYTRLLQLGGGGGGSAAAANIFDVFAAGEVPYGGIRASYRGADGGWSARGIQSVPDAQASVFLPISGTPGAGWRFTFEEALAIGAAGNAWRLLRFPRSPIVPAVAASLQWEYRPGRYITITAATAGTVGNSYAMNAFILGSTGVVSYIRSNAQGPRFDVRVVPSTTVADLITGANAAFSDVVFSPGTGYIATDTLTNQLLGPGGSGYARFSRGANEVPGQTILATVHSAPSVSFTLRIAATDTLADIRSAIISYLTSEGIVLSTVGVVDEATDTFDVPAVDPGLGFAGGVNGLPLGASVDDTSKIIDITYDAGTNTLAEILAEMVTAGIQPEYRGSVDGAESPEAVGWIRTLGPITAAGGTTGTGPATPALSGAQIKQKYEANANTNPFTNAEKAKLGGVEAGAEANVGSEFTQAEKTKLTAIEADATADQTGTEIKTAYEGESDTNAFTNALKTKLEGIATAATAVSIIQVLAKIFAGTGININRGVDGQITITNTGAGGGGGGTDDVVTTAMFDENTQIVTLTTTSGGTVTVSLGKFITVSELASALTPYTKADGTVAFTAVVAGVTPTDDAHLSTKKYVDDADVLKASLSGATFTGETRGLTPVNDPDFATKAYVDAAVAGTTPPSVRSELIYYGLILAANAADLAAAITYAETIDVSTLDMEDATVAGHNIRIGPSENSDFFVFLVPAVHDLLTLINLGTQGDERNTYSRSENARNDLGTPSEQYNSYVIGPLNPGVSIGYRLTLTE